MFTKRAAVALAAGVALAGPPQRPARCDAPLYAYEGTALPYAPGVGFTIFNACDGVCFDYLEDAHYVAQFANASGQGSGFNYHHDIALPGQNPPSLFVEARFRSNSHYDGIFDGNDAQLTARFRGIVDLVDIQGDAVHSFSGDFEVLGLSTSEFHSYRFESTDAQHWTWAVDGLVFYNGYTPNMNGGSYVQFGGQGTAMPPPGMLKNEWHWIRYGTLSYGEVVVASDPPNGYIDPRQDRPSNVNTPQGLTRLTVVFDQPNGLKISNITVQSTAPASQWPVVEWVTRPEGDEGDTWEIRLNQRIPPGHRTRFIISDEAEAAAVGQVGASSVVEYGFLPADVNGDSVANTQDLLAWIQAVNAGTANVLHHDINRDEVINTIDLLRTVHLLNGLNTLQPWNGVSLPNWP